MLPCWQRLRYALPGEQLPVGQTVTCRRLLRTRPQILGPTRFMQRMRGLEFGHFGMHGRTMWWKRLPHSVSSLPTRRQDGSRTPDSLALCQWNIKLGEADMTDKKRPRDPASSEDKIQVPKRKTIPASDVGVSLTVSDKALKEVERLQEKTIEAAQEVHKFSWR